MRFAFLLGMAFLASGSVSALDVPAVPGKGTIGLVCLDATGMLHFASATDNSGFESCVDQVVKTWTSKNESTSQSSFDEMVQGMTTYRMSVDRAIAEGAAAKK